MSQVIHDEYLIIPAVLLLSTVRNEKNIGHGCAALVTIKVFFQ